MKGELGASMWCGVTHSQKEERSSWMELYSLHRPSDVSEWPLDMCVCVCVCVCVFMCVCLCVCACVCVFVFTGLEYQLVASPGTSSWRAGVSEQPYCSLSQRERESVCVCEALCVCVQLTLSHNSSQIVSLAVPHHLLHWLQTDRQSNTDHTSTLTPHTLLCWIRTLNPELFSCSAHSSQVTRVGVASALEGVCEVSLESVLATSSRSPSPWLIR